MYQWFSVGFFAENSYGEEEFQMLSESGLRDIISGLELLREQKANTNAHRKDLAVLIKRIKELREHGTGELTFVGDD